jgi:hypothetical protein
VRLRKPRSNPSVVRSLEKNVDEKKVQEGKGVGKGGEVEGRPAKTRRQLSVNALPVAKSKLNTSKKTNEKTNFGRLKSD